MKLAGTTESILVANSAPAKLANNAPIANAESFAATVFTPIASATVSSSRIAIHDRPVREFSSAYGRRTR